MSNPPNARGYRAVKARQILQTAIRSYFEEQGFDEVEPPLLVPAPGMEPHITVFETRFLPEMGAKMPPRTLYLHSSPEYAMKRLLADGWEKIYFLGKVFRNGEIAKLHNPEFTMLEFYRGNLPEPPEGERPFEPLLRDIEAFTLRAAHALGKGDRVGELRLDAPWERLSVADAFRRHAGVELPLDGDAELLLRRAEEAGIELAAGIERYDDVFFAIFLTEIEPKLGRGRPTFLIDWPAQMASLAKLRMDDPRVAERFELYFEGIELANGFFELDDAEEQRRRLVEEQRFRKAEGLPVYPLDERFLEAVGRMPPSAGVAVGFDRLLMHLAGFETIDEVLLFPSSVELS